MTRPLIALSVFAAAFAGAPLSAQQPVDTGDDRYNMVVVYGDDACPVSNDDTIVVCARKAESERFRIPEALRYSTDPANQSWAQRVEKLEMVGAFGTLSCTPVGAGGWTGCTQEMINKAYADKAEGRDVRFSQIIADARAERLSTIDGDAERTQRDVEMIEREYLQRLENERAAPTPDEAAAEAAAAAAAAPEPTVVAGEVVPEPAEESPEN